jgi:hypothetical protein
VKRTAAPTTERMGMSIGMLERSVVNASPVRSAVKAVDLMNKMNICRHR